MATSDAASVRSRPPTASRSSVSSTSGAASSSSRPSSAKKSARPGSAAAERPFSASNLLATVANARFKTFQVQHDVLGKNPILAAMALDISWKNLFDLFTLKFFAAGDELFRQGEHTHELVFVLCGGFLARRLAPESVVHESMANGFGHHKQQRVVLSERMFKPGAAMLAYPVEKNMTLPYSVIAAKFKSIALTLPSGKFRSIWRQVSQETREKIEVLARESERALVLTLGLAIRGEDAVYGGNLWRRGESEVITAVGTDKGDPSKRSPRKAVSKSSVGSISAKISAAVSAGDNHGRQLQHSASMPAGMGTDVTWSTLQTAKPAEYMVNSSLLILHERPATTSSLSLASTSANQTATSTRPGTNQKLVRSSSSAVVSAKAKKHTQRRLQSIKMPSAVDAFPRRQWAGIDLDDIGNEEENDDEVQGDGRRKWDSLSLEAIEQLLGKQAVLGGSSRALDVVPRVRVGRLLKPLKKPAMIGDSGGDGSWGGRDRRLLVANRSETFRDEAYKL